MKKLRLLLISVLCILTAFACSLTASAKAVEYYLEDLGMTISISDSMSVKVKGPESDLPKEKYLEATSKDKGLKISITMDTNETSKKIGSLADQPSEVIDKIKENLENEGLSESKEATYGDVTFFDFSKKEVDVAGNDIYTLQSITYINGMSVAIVSQSNDKNFTSDEISIIKESLESIRFDSVEQAQKENTAKTVKTWVIVILAILLTAGAGVLIFTFVKKKKSRSAFESQKSKKTDYDVFKSSTPTTQQGQIGGYKTSTDYFDNHFDKAPAQRKKPTVTDNTPAKKTGAVTRIGYFAKNLSREISKAKAKQNKSKNSKSKTKAKPKAVDYDIFSGK